MSGTILLLKAYILLVLAMTNGESLQEAGADYFEAQCYIDGYEAQSCSYARSQGVIKGLFPMDLTSNE